MNCRLRFLLPIFCVVAVAHIAGQERLHEERRSQPASVGGVVAKPKPWMLDDTQRLALRIASTASHHGTDAAKQGFVDHVDGHTQPALLLPFELFDSLLKGLGADPALRENAHKSFDARLRSFGYDPDKFWAVLRSASLSYIARLDAAKQKRGMSTFKTSGGKTLWAPISQDLCMDRAAALQSSRRAFGPTKFDEILYSVVAPEVAVSSTGSLSSSDHMEQLAYMARGCK